MCMWGLNSARYSLFAPLHCSHCHFGALTGLSDNDDIALTRTTRAPFAFTPRVADNFKFREFPNPSAHFLLPLKGYQGSFAMGTSSANGPWPTYISELTQRRGPWNSRPVSILCNLYVLRTYLRDMGATGAMGLAPTAVSRSSSSHRTASPSPVSSFCC